MSKARLAYPLIDISLSDEDYTRLRDTHRLEHWYTGKLSFEVRSKTHSQLVQALQRKQLWSVRAVKVADSNQWELQLISWRWGRPNEPTTHDSMVLESARGALPKQAKALAYAWLCTHANKSERKKLEIDKQAEREPVFAIFDSLSFGFLNRQAFKHLAVFGALVLAWMHFPLWTVAGVVLYLLAMASHVGLEIARAKLRHWYSRHGVETLEEVEL